jgi:hypothetical protein
VTTLNGVVLRIKEVQEIENHSRKASNLRLRKLAMEKTHHH